MLKIGNTAPVFSLQGIDHSGKEQEYISAALLKDKHLIVYFYPKDDTPGCTKESCSFNASLIHIRHKAHIIGISADGIASHLKFLEKHHLLFPLLSDTDLKVAKSFGATKVGLLGGDKISRSTFLINKNGVLAGAWYDVKVDGHTEEVLAELNKLES